MRQGVQHMKMDNPRGKLALVTASTRGIGFEVAKHLFLEGYSVVINGRSSDHLQQAREKILACRCGNQTVKTVRADLRAPLACKELVRTVEELDQPLSCAFINTPTPRMGSPRKLSDSDWQEAIQGLLRLTDSSLTLLGAIIGRNGGGAVVLNASCSARAPIESRFYFANTLRATTVSQAKAHARELIKKNVRVNILLTGYVDSDLTRNAALKLAEEQDTSIDTVFHQWGEQIPIGRLATPVEIAQVAMFLLGESSSYIVGCAIEVDGGLAMNHYSF